MMKTFSFAVILATSNVAAWADKYGIDESMSESNVSVGGLICFVALLAYLHFKD